MSDTAVQAPPSTQTPKAQPKRQVEPQRRSQPRKQPPYAVIIQNDDEHTFAYVIEVIQRICGKKLPDAMKLTWQIHTSGQAAVWTGMREVAELKRDQIRGFGPDYYAEMTVRYPLGVRIEPMPEG